jgi:ketosteroid isomerase-like protein
MSQNEQDVLAAEQRFFDGLTEGSVEGLDAVLSDDFILVDVMMGSVIPKADLLAVIGAGQLKFLSVERVEASVRFYGTAAVVVGRTQMSGLFGEAGFTTKSRYTHVFAEQQGQWRLVSAQGTQIAELG